MTRSEKLVKWLFFSVFLALLPLAFNAFGLLFQSQDLTLDGLLQNGELLLVAASLSAAAIGELIGSGPNRRLAKIVSGGGAVLVLCMASFFFAIVASTTNNENADVSFVAWTSVVFFVCAIFAGGSCLSLAEV